MRLFFRNPSDDRKGFTIIEMLVVISVIAILASILLPAIGTAQKKARIAKTQAMIDSITTALKQYRTDFGSYPPDDSVPGTVGVNSSECAFYYTAATFVAGNNSADTSAGPYMEYRQKDKSASGHNADVDGDGATDDALFEIVDPWGSVLVYEKPGTNNTSSFDLHSPGPDGTDGNNDDIKNW
jgi:prepilin-type N-terminal cleavage/methylation domain-containing protein